MKDRKLFYFIISIILLEMIGTLAAVVLIIVQGVVGENYFPEQLLKLLAHTISSGCVFCYLYRTFKDEIKASFSQMNGKLIWRMCLFLIFRTWLYSIGNWTESENQLAFNAMKNMNIWISGIQACVFTPLVEEIMFRRCLFEYILTRLGSNLGAVIAVTFMFAVYHTGVSNIRFIMAYLIPSFLLTVEYARHKNITYNIFLHGIWNIFAYF